MATTTLVRFETIGDVTVELHSFVNVSDDEWKHVVRTLVDSSETEAEGFDSSIQAKRYFSGEVKSYRKQAQDQAQEEIRDAEKATALLASLIKAGRASDALEALKSL